MHLQSYLFFKDLLALQYKTSSAAYVLLCQETSEQDTDVSSKCPSD